MGVLTRCAPFLIVLLPRPWQLKEGEEAECVPVQVAVGVQLRLLFGGGVSRGEGEAQVVAHLFVKTTKLNQEECGGVNLTQRRCFLLIFASKKNE